MISISHWGMFPLVIKSIFDQDVSGFTLHAAFGQNWYFRQDRKR